jgi:DNA-binding MarR family transcriptional regulator
MQADLAAQRFAAAFHELFLGLHRRRAKAQRELSFEAWGVLEHLSRTGPLTVTEAARHFARSQAATSELLARLARRGLVQRFRDARDRRRAIVWLTAAGLTVWRQSTRVLDDERLLVALERLSPGARRNAVLALERVVRVQQVASPAESQ